LSRTDILTLHRAEGAYYLQMESLEDSVWYREREEVRMKSKAHVKGHPIHPMLVAFPIAFLVGSLGFDAAGRLWEWPAGWTTGAYLNLAAIATGLAAAVPGLIDYFSVVPPDSSAKTRATQHLLVNSSALTLFALAWVFRDRTSLMPGYGSLLLEAGGVGLVTWGGWLGGTLVYRNQIGVDHRYADAGKWQEVFADGRGDPVVVDKEGELEVDQMKLVHAGGRRVVVARAGDYCVAFADRCSHKGGPLSDGVMICGTVQCPWHGSQFDARTGAVKAGPAKEPIATYPLEQTGDEVRLRLPESAAKAGV
jgi:nitrite reductase/ring-hydroxylating ferredoxin subunit/uncharacterized membrane protein